MSEAPVPVIRLNQEEPDLSAGRYCVNCRWFIADVRAPRCDAPQSWTGAIDPVTGRRVLRQKYFYCNVLRQSPARADNCGIEGQWFEPREIVSDKVAAE